MINSAKSLPLQLNNCRLNSLYTGSWMVEETGIRNEVAILDSRGYVLAGLSQPLTRPRPSCAIQDDELIKKCDFFVPSNCLHAGYCLKNLISFREFDITCYVKFSFEEKISLKTKSYSHQSRLFAAVSILFLRVWPEIHHKFIQFLLRNYF